MENCNDLKGNIVMETEESYGASPKRDSVTWEITESLGVLRVSQSGWTKEVNMVSWNGNKPKVDIREWSPDRGKISKGITLNDLEAEQLTSWLLAKGYGKDAARRRK